MKKLICTVFAVAMTAAAGAAFAEDDPAMLVAPNALRTIPQDPATADSMPNDTKGDLAAQVQPDTQSGFSGGDAILFVWDEDFSGTSSD